MDVAWHELGKRVHNGNNGFAEIGVCHPGGAPQRAGTRHITAVGGSGGTILRHALFTPVYLLNGTVRAVPLFYFGLT
jgi:hypothetical protein